MQLITWNVQWCRGVDGKVDPARVVAEARRLADFDVLCLQEVADNFPAPRLPGSAGEDQFALLAALLPGYTAIAGVAVDHPGDDRRRRRFGNMIFSRLLVQQVFRHLLPYPAVHDVPGMPRIALEAVVTMPFGNVRVITTHLEYYSLKKRSMQVDALRAVYAEGYRHSVGSRVTMDDGGPFQTFPRPAATIITGDFNLEPDDPLHARLVAPFDDGTPALVDAWEHVHPGVAHPPTVCIYQKIKPGDPQMCFDYVVVDPEAAQRVRAMTVDVVTQVSDHQPVILTLG
ncbi:MAG: endonuclease/exonuclease/phosphatase family protein [Casimicrobiaceae bacterium]